MRRLAFVVPAGSSWPLPLYELALMLAERAYSMCARPRTALRHAGADAAGAVRRRGLARGRRAADRGRDPARGHARRSSSRLGGSGWAGRRALEVARIVTLPRLQGPAIPGLPADPEGFLVTDGHARVRGVADVYAAGDVTAFPVKQGGIACQQADAAAADIAARAGAPVKPEPFAPVLRGMLLTERWARFLRREAHGAGEPSEVAGRALWWPPTKIAGRELAGYLEGLDEEAGRPSRRCPSTSTSATPARARSKSSACTDHVPGLLTDDALRRLLDAGRAVVSELDVEAVLDRVLATAAEVTGARYAALGVLDERRRSSSASSPTASRRRPTARSASCRAGTACSGR